MIREAVQVLGGAAGGEFISDAAEAAGTYRKQGTRWVIASGGVRPRRGRKLKGRCLARLSGGNPLYLRELVAGGALVWQEASGGCGTEWCPVNMERWTGVLAPSLDAGSPVTTIKFRLGAAVTTAASRRSVLQGYPSGQPNTDRPAVFADAWCPRNAATKMAARNKAGEPRLLGVILRSTTQRIAA